MNWTDLSSWIKILLFKKKLELKFNFNQIDQLTQLSLIESIHN
jgi:hypothetical protein